MTLVERIGACFFSMHNPVFLGILNEVAFVTEKVLKEKSKRLQEIVERSHARAAQAWGEEATHRMGPGASEGTI